MRLFFFALLLTGLWACQRSASSNELVVSGKIEGLSPTWVYLEEVPLATMQRLVVDSVMPDKDGAYSLRAKPSEQQVYNIRIGEQPYPAASLINDTTVIGLDVFFNPGNAQLPDRYVVSGSRSSKALQQYMLTFNTKLQEAFLLRKQNDSLKTVVPLQDSLWQAGTAKLQEQLSSLYGITRSYLDSNQSPALTMMILGYYQNMAGNPAFGLRGFDNNEVRDLVNQVANKFREHQGVAALKVMLQEQFNKNKGWVGLTAPEFSLPDPTGKMISLSAFRGKYVLVDFWASWCKPCRMENPVVVAAYKQFKNRNFTVLGVSLDEPDGRDAWMNAVMKDGLAWTQVSDLKAWDSPVVGLYNITGIPFNVLLDPQGKVIAESLRGEDLSRTLDKVLPKQ